MIAFHARPGGQAEGWATLPRHPNYAIRLVFPVVLFAHLLGRMWLTLTQAWDECWFRAAGWVGGETG